MKPYGLCSPLGNIPAEQKLNSLQSKRIQFVSIYACAKYTELTRQHRQKQKPKWYITVQTIDCIVSKMNIDIKASVQST